MTGPSRLLRRLALLVLPVAAAGGCVERELVVDSNPDGALVYMNGQEAGRTPFRREFDWYGTYEVAIRKEGFETVKVNTPVIAPPWLWVPFDFVLEVLPIRFTDTHRLKYEMQPTTAADADPEQMMARAKAMQKQLESGEKTVVKPPSTKPATKPVKAKPATRPATTRGN